MAWEKCNAFNEFFISNETSRIIIHKCIWLWLKIAPSILFYVIFLVEILPVNSFDMSYAREAGISIVREQNIECRINTCIWVSRRSRSWYGRITTVKKVYMCVHVTFALAVTLSGPDRQTVISTSVTVRLSVRTRTLSRNPHAHEGSRHVYLLSSRPSRLHNRFFRHEVAIWLLHAAVPSTRRARTPPGPHYIKKERD